jgi:pimeloyl-ACP methyl ester carboxylesterase
MYKLENGTFWCVDIDHDNIKHSPLAEPHLIFTRIPTRLGSTIATMFLPSSTPSDVTILFSHGNAADLGSMQPYLHAMVRKLKVNVYAYDYTGYGLSSGGPAPGHVLADAEAALDHLKATYPNKSKKTIVYGQSLGSAPTVWLGRTRQEDVSGVVVHSGLASALRCIRAVDDSKWFDIFPNVDWMREVSAPVFVIHGTNDVGIPVKHGESLVRAARHAYPPWYVLGGGHNDIEIVYKGLYYQRLRRFVADVKAGTCRNVHDDEKEQQPEDPVEVSAAVVPTPMGMEIQ